MSGELNLNTLLSTMEGELVDGTFVFVTIKDGQLPEGIETRMIFEEKEGTSLILLKSEAERFDLSYEFPSRMITLNIHSSLEAVGFIARIATELAAEDMGVNPVAGFYHDHIFIPEGREDDALRVLKRIAEQNTA